VLPSLVAEELRESLSSFLGTTFALADDDVRTALEQFLSDPVNGVFRGPYVRLRLPFRGAEPGWEDLLDFVPRGFTPHRHQAQAWARLSSRGRNSQPTLVATGTGSGKTESFLVPLLDHCRRERGRPGIKAIVLYPMNALANDQARRIATMIHAHPDELGGVTAGLYTGDAPATVAMSAEAVIGDRHALRRHPPDILLTNYKMLDMLLLRGEDAPLFAAAGTSLRYLVLDEFHTYDGAQGTDVAMLLRRLGMTLGTGDEHGPLGRITPVATSATLGTGTDSAAALRDFAGTVFGTPFEADSIISEDRLHPQEWAGSTEGAVPLLDDVTDTLAGCATHAQVVEATARVFLGHLPSDTAELGEALRRHPFTARLVALAGTSRALTDLAAEVEPGWVTRPAPARAAVSAFLALLSEAQDENGRPLLNVDVQLWLREVRRVLRHLDVVPRFAWQDGGALEDGQALAAAYCRHCGRSGWGTSAKPAGGYTVEPTAVWSSAMTERRAQRTWIFAPREGAAGDARVQWVDPDTADLSPKPRGRHTTDVPVLVTPDKDAAATGRCPSCGLNDGIRFLGSSVATLASAALGHVFASPNVEPEQKKTLVFTDSVQDASHRAVFIESRAYALNRRSLLLRAIPTGGCTLDDIGASVTATASTAAERYALLPPELKSHQRFRDYWSKDRPDKRSRDAVTRLLDFEAAREFGLSARVGRTLELTGAATAHVQVANLDDVIGNALEQVSRYSTQLALPTVAHGETQLALDESATTATRAWARGVLERIRLQGGIQHRWLDAYLASGGNRFSIWGGRPRYEGVPAFPTGRPAPSFPTTARATDAFDTIVGATGWYSTWTARALQVPSVDASRYVRALLDACTDDGILREVAATGGALVWTLSPERVRVAPTAGLVRTLRCGVCASYLPGPEEVLQQLAGAPCMRTACSGRYTVTILGDDYYRELYRSGQVRRIVAAEHTSLLPADARVQLETRFKKTDQDADDPNVLTCTPTLELGIDIGDLTMVTLTSLPRSTASYLQRVGRAGRLTGSSLVLSLLPARPLELQRLVDPLTMIAGEVVPPACYLDAGEILRRQYFASLVDRHARTAKQHPVRRAMDVLAGGLAPTSWLGKLVGEARENADTYVTEFVAGFGGALAKETVEELRRWAGVLSDSEVPDMERAVELACSTWRAETAEMDQRRVALRAELQRIEAMPSLDDAQKRDRNRVRGELGAVRAALTEQREGYWVSALEDLGLLPTYSLVDDRTQLDVGLWWTDDETGATERSDDRYQRGSRTALSELAPGATFYVRGAAVEIDGLDMGSSMNPTTELRRFCPSCGWSDRASVTISSCPRCGDVAAADTGQISKTLPFRKASAYSSRDRAERADDHDDRKRTVFTLRTTVDADPADISAAWRLEDFPFGVEVLRRADIRWVNLGPAERHGAALEIAGEEVSATQFDTCTRCGVVWAAQAGTHGRADARHRGWCAQRREPSDDLWTSVVLTHHLRTQAVRLLVPPIVTTDATQLVSFRAALLLGLRAVLGGDPDHLDVVTAIDPAPGQGQRWAMVLHDVVPGGTGYLSRFTEPEEVRRLLEAALAVVATCECKSEAVAACHRCLLPHVAPFQAPLARRDRAEELLTQILQTWFPKRIPSLRSIVVGSHDTPIERRFRELLVSWAKSRGASVSLHASSEGDSAEIVLSPADNGLRWNLEPQVMRGFVKPDFELTTDDPDCVSIAVFCDGVRYHTSGEHNGVADDATKRAALRHSKPELLVWSVTHHDLDLFETSLKDGASTPPAWAAPGVIPAALGFGEQLCGVGDASVTAMVGDTLSVLTEVLLKPDQEKWAAAARSVALALADQPSAHPVTTTCAAFAELVRADALGAKLESPPGSEPLVMTRTPGGLPVGVDIRTTDDVRTILVVDDRDATVGSPAQVSAWRDWLALSNLLQLLGDVDRMQALSTSHDVTEGVFTPVTDPAWAAVADVFDGDIAALARALGSSGTPLAEPGLEVADGEHTLDLAWPDARVAVIVGADPGRDRWMSEHRWTAVAADASAVRAALGLTEATP